MICFVSIAFTSFDDDNIVHMFTIIIFLTLTFEHYIYIVNTIHSYSLTLTL